MDPSGRIAGIIVTIYRVHEVAIEDTSALVNCSGGSNQKT